MSIFDWIKHIIKEKTHYTSFTPNDWKNYDIFMINKFLSMNPVYVNIVEYIQGFSNLTKEKHYRLYCDIIPQSNKTYSPYIKSKTQKLNKEKLRYIADIFEVSLNEANDYVDLMDKQWLEDILKSYGKDKKEIKKLIKQ